MAGPLPVPCLARGESLPPGGAPTGQGLWDASERWLASAGSPGSGREGVAGAGGTGLQVVSPQAGLSLLSPQRDGGWTALGCQNPCCAVTVELNKQ